MKERNIALCIILSIVTCGIYGIYWFIAMTNDANQACADDYQTSGGVAFLLTIVTCGIYSFYWAYKMGEKVNTIKARKGEPSDSNNILYLVLCIFGLGIVTYCLLQSELNKVA